MKSNKDIIILKDDKGNAPVIMNRTQYNKKMEEHLNQSDCYKVIDKDRSNKIPREVSKKIKESSLEKILKRGSPQQLHHCKNI